jgi:hypothetical protein
MEKEACYAYSGATLNMTYQKSALINYKEVKVGSWTLKRDKWQSANVEGFGTIVFTSNVNRGTYNRCS